MKFSEAIEIIGPDDVEGLFRVGFRQELESRWRIDFFPDPKRQESPFTSLNEAWEYARRFAGKAPWALNVSVINAESGCLVDPHRIYNPIRRAPKKIPTSFSDHSE